MWKKEGKAGGARAGVSRPNVEKGGCFWKKGGGGGFSTKGFSFSTGNVEKFQWRALMLVFISFTVSAKAGSRFIFFSTCWME